MLVLQAGDKKQLKHRKIATWCEI